MDKTLFVKQGGHPFWQYLYQYGQKVPFISAVYGNVVYQDCRKNKKYFIYLGTSGFIAREEDEEEREQGNSLMKF